MSAHMQHPMRAPGGRIKLTPRGRSGQAKVERPARRDEVQHYRGLRTWDTKARDRQDFSRHL